MIEVIVTFSHVPAVQVQVIGMCFCIPGVWVVVIYLPPDQVECTGTCVLIPTMRSEVIGTYIYAPAVQVEVNGTFVLQLRCPGRSYLPSVSSGRICVFVFLLQLST